MNLPVELNVKSTGEEIIFNYEELEFLLRNLSDLKCNLGISNSNETVNVEDLTRKLNTLIQYALTP
jgi:phage gp36-like protein